MVKNRKAERREEFPVQLSQNHIGTETKLKIQNTKLAKP